MVLWVGWLHHPERVQAPAKDTDETRIPNFADPYIWPEAEMNVGWEIYPQGLYFCHEGSAMSIQSC